jgi:hypothetical protein
MAARWMEHYSERSSRPADYEPGRPACLDYTAALESTLLHARNVLEFLMLARDPETRSAVQFADAWDPKPVRERLGSLYADICGHLSHLAVRRPETPPKWALLAVVDSVLTEFEKLLDAAGQGDLVLLHEGAAIARRELSRAQEMAASIGQPDAEHEP